MQKQRNREVRNYLIDKKVFQYELAEELEMTEPALSVLLRYELDEFYKNHLLDAIDRCAAKKNV